jgi:hypothetical protein
MVRLEVIEMQEPASEALDALKAYAAVSDAGQEHLLAMALRRAFGMVQQQANRALLAGRFIVKAADHGRNLRAYMGGQCVSVKDGDGAEVSWHQRGEFVYVGTDEPVEAEVVTHVNAADYDALLPVVLKYATAIYDGKESRELSQILRECL